ncbi:MAG TPA: 16S rRNA (cytosine(1402)-N(4))-methyltransferase RsmH [Bacillota bacterium]|nr:16S rRNA (cytosine(1402)-N(4))-methyltransferase RsmH [Bacillota bacterium]
MKKFEHEPVMAGEVFEMLNLGPGDIYLDCTLGGAGHALKAAGIVGQGGTIIGLDVDSDAIEAAQQRLSGADCEVFIEKSSYTQLEEVLAKFGISSVDGVLFDLGVSSYQLDEAERGFTYREDAPLDMRMDRQAKSDAASILNNYDECSLARIIRDFGEERWASRIAKFVVDRRTKAPMTTTGQLIEAIEAAIPKGAREKGQHPARRTFQALRIAVNTELENVRDALPKAIRALKPGGRLAVLSYHSLEDRIVKDIFRTKENPCKCPPELPVCACGAKAEVKVLTRKPILPSDEEIEINPRSRSAKLRAVEKISQE